MVILCAAALVPALLIGYLALSKKVSPAVKKASLAALVLIIVSCLVCGFILFLMLLGPASGPLPAVSDMPTAAGQESRQDIITLLIIAAVVLLFMLLIFFVSIREKRTRRSSRTGRNGVR